MPAKAPIKFSSDRNVFILDVPKHEEIIDKGTHYETADGAVVNWGSEPHNNERAVKDHIANWKSDRDYKQWKQNRR